MSKKSSKQFMTPRRPISSCQGQMMRQMPFPYVAYQPPGTGTPYVSQPDSDRQLPVPVMNENYIQGYLQTIKGKYVKVDFLIGTNTFIDREGTLIDVGIDYIVLREPETDDLLLCDMYSIKFVKIFY